MFDGFITYYLVQQMITSTRVNHTEHATVPLERSRAKKINECRHSGWKSKEQRTGGTNKKCSVKNLLITKVPIHHETASVYDVVYV